MIYKIFTVYDSKVEAYLQPFFMRSKGEAIRAFSELVNDPQHNFSKYPSDFTLFELAEFTDETAGLFPLKTPVSLGVGIEFVKSTGDVA